MIHEVEIFMDGDTTVDITIVGSGIVGMSIGYELTKKYPNLTIAILEKEMNIGDHTSGRNSGVLHSGIYYPYNSLKLKHCMNGVKLWNTFCKIHTIKLENTGKYIISTKKEDLKKLTNLYENAILNQVIGLRKISKEEKDYLFEFCNIEDALFIGSSSVVDVSNTIKVLQNQLIKSNVYILKQNELLNIEYNSNKNNFRLLTNKDNFTTKYLINSAGLQAVNIRKKLGLIDFENYYVKGHYMKYKSHIPIHSLIYPIPPSELGLGVHLTLDTQWDIKFGPNTIKTDNLSYDSSDFNENEMVKSIQVLFKNIKRNDLYWDYAGIRPKVMKNGVLATDFVIQDEMAHRIKGYIELLGIDSPGLTSCFSLGEYVTSLVKL